MLGPILFLIYNVNDLTQYISNCFVLQYADDTQFIYTGSIGNAATFKIARNYFNVNGLLLNTKETHCMFVGSRGYI